ncbi:bifunctional diaminohydroxyphosphoribosylaminopyrimidine deaminase/5-amino-6-(5-phosphoribosylamino)uracil reductase RibD [Flavisolibacter ginsenosidimutans]|uniref:Riboflavin biosynthesis protein RibD n=2 Tax=Flavisolibacter ginsenosidimutans TaxID=661481 RepID=A0A5B8UCX2_9BACT|nr:bifunctional diaminohydroxyphosphoribosylaminopyrimidine deaminase/5-amino-6-(5-phosphoribosylamino)uracil reductase RibD [Flavisolibacter ginsenosidimutans]
MRRCLQLAKLAGGNVAPNPMVGSVLVYEDRIIGEGYHQQYGQAHAEVNCLASVKEADLHLVPKATLYVSLEPCAHWGKTPPCADLIVSKKIPTVVVGCRDPFPQVNGKGIERLKAAGVEVNLGVLENECKELNKRFFTFHTAHRPYVVLKWAQSGNQKIGCTNAERVFISNEYSNRLVHKWRSEEAAILVGTNTALNDDPQLNTRLWPGRNPVRIVVDMNLRLPRSLRLFDGTIPTIVFNKHQHSLPFEKISTKEVSGTHYYQITDDASLVHQFLNGLYRLGIQSVLVEGGAKLLQSFIDEGEWDEARIITNEQLLIDKGLPAPMLSNERLTSSERIMNDTLRYYRNCHTK